VAPRQPRIIIVDDDDFTRFLLVRTVGDFGFDVFHAPHAVGALTLVDEQGPVDLALLDLDLGRGPNGVDLAYALRKRQPAIGIVLLTSYDDIRLIGTRRTLPVGGVQLSKQQLADEDSLRTTLSTVLAHPRRDRNSAEVPPMQGTRLGISSNQIEIMRLVAEGFYYARTGASRVRDRACDSGS
jgi:CheY-like chemotaxis protein